MIARRSRQIQLVTLGSVILGGCSDADLPKDRYAYKARAECVQDWGDVNCARSASSGGYFHGPGFNSVVAMPDGRHIWSGNASMPAVNPRTGQQMHSAANVSAARGGFGHTGSSIRSSGS